MAADLAHLPTCESGHIAQRHLLVLWLAPRSSTPLLARPGLKRLWVSRRQQAKLRELLLVLAQELVKRPLDLPLQPGLLLTPLGHLRLPAILARVHVRLARVTRLTWTSAARALLERTIQYAGLQLAEDQVVQRLENVAAVHLGLARPPHHLFQVADAHSRGLRRALLKPDSLSPDGLDLDDMTLMLRCHVHLDLVQVLKQAPVLLVEPTVNAFVDLAVPVLQLLLQDGCLEGHRSANNLCDLGLKVAVAGSLLRSSFFASSRA